MLVYRSAERHDDSVRLVESLHSRLSTITAMTLRHDDCTDVLFAAAELETALVDARAVNRDDIDSLTTALRELTDTAACAYLASMRRRVARAAHHLRRAKEQVAALSRHITSQIVRCTVPEGYAHYALYPEMYVDAADLFVQQCAPTGVTVIGLRSIGTSLAAVVAATLAERGIDTLDVTVRPRGHPFERRLVIGTALRRMLRERAHGWFAIVDEGPGLSGSSMSCVADALSSLGVDDGRIVFLPSWSPEPSMLLNEQAQSRWCRHRKFIGSFERAFIANNRLARAWNGRIVADWSAGRWRESLPRGTTGPPVQPQHESRKYLLERDDESRIVLKFNGLGKYGQSRIEIARHLAKLGAGPAVLGESNGFVATTFVEGDIGGHGGFSAAQLREVGRYVAARPTATDDQIGATSIELAEMVSTNARDLIGREPPIGRVPHQLLRRVAIDGRMMPHEWLVCRDKLVKTDGANHHNDHFYPGCTDPAWDIAGACIELCVRDDERELVIESYISESGDHMVRERLPWWTLAYAAFRGAYAQTAATALGDSFDGLGMRAECRRYVGIIHDRIAFIESSLSSW